MSKYLGRLKALDLKKRLPQQLTELTEAPCVSSVSSQGGHFLKIEAGIMATSRLAPRIVKEPPFGSDGVPERFRAAWEALLAQCPPPVPPIVWQAAITDAADLFSYWGLQLVSLAFTPTAVFDVPHSGKPGGLAWFMKGSPVMALGPGMAQLQDGRIWQRAKA